ncbi:hypothetical protein BBK36DRAFT_1143551 [Trichoderma citrinoviride]|uniref:Uncharacterized protein n=1 Tax=Trichoderma citrinoviride TaxID=58853 RepID=A0A2T4B3D2_9HYPO|nr:hypothetical protein BBK36DRAFT_1143551 [Trichoderma citrinoviride]PTB63843.1 hypothetical protein BBK36DRAFT_1143551 [Trichoderma citrinoviride]
MSLVLDTAETERSVAVSGCKMDNVDKMRMQSRGWACADAADSSRPFRTMAVVETSSTNKALGFDACSMHDVDERHDSGNPSCSMQPHLVRLASILPVILRDAMPHPGELLIVAAIAWGYSNADTSQLATEADGLVYETSKVLCPAAGGASAKVLPEVPPRSLFCNEQLALNKKIFTVTYRGLGEEQHYGSIVLKDAEEQTTSRRTRPSATIAIASLLPKTGHFHLRQYWRVCISQRTN